MDSEVLDSEISDPACGKYWENRYKNGDTPWEKGRAHPELVRRLSIHSLPLVRRVLVPGCGYGHDARAFLKITPPPLVMGLEISSTAVKAAKGLSVGESYYLGSILEPPEELTGFFDFAFEHTCFCALPPRCRKRYFLGLRKLLTKDALVWFILYVDPDHEVGPPFGCSYSDFIELTHPFFRILEVSQVHETFPGRENREMFSVLQAV
ncbi:MAG: TPMT family class I SAM-dependent methyltransferase [Chthoniobacterales bacterium]|nr:TPMT family class I SAM-dependent methyltransferase [Chthoniobacterales bacterium]